MKLLNIVRQNRKTKVFVFGKKILSFKTNKKTPFDLVFERRFDGLTEDELKYCVLE